MNLAIHELPSKRSIGNSWIERHSRVRLNLSAVHSPLYSTEGVSKLMREPVFNETLQLGIVVRDLEATVRRYVDDYGIGPWDFAQIDAGDANNYREYGQPVERSTRIAVATVGQVMWRENNVILSGEFSGVDVAYLNTQRDLGVTIEIASGMP